MANGPEGRGALLHAPQDEGRVRGSAAAYRQALPSQANSSPSRSCGSVRRGILGSHKSFNRQLPNFYQAKKQPIRPPCCGSHAALLLLAPSCMPSSMLPTQKQEPESQANNRAERNALGSRGSKPPKNEAPQQPPRANEVEIRHRLTLADLLALARPR